MATQPQQPHTTADTLDTPHTVSSAPDDATSPEPDVCPAQEPAQDMHDEAPTQALPRGRRRKGKQRADKGASTEATPLLGQTYSRPRGPRWRNYTAFVLSGGGARGALQVGALRALLERGIVPDVVIGTSIGAWNGAWLANDPTLEGVEKLADIWRGLRAEQLLLGYESFRAPMPSLANILVAAAAAPRLVMGYSSFYSDVGLKRLIKRCVGDATFADLKATLRIIATDLTHGVRAVFSEGPLAAPILASSAIPAVFPPVRIGDSVYADGCALDSCSIETAINLGARRLFVLSVGYDGSEEDSQYWSQTLAPVPPAQLTPAQSNSRHATPHAQNHAASHGMAAIFERITQVMGYYQLSQALQRIPRGVETHVINLPSGHSGGMLDFDAAGRWMDDAYLFARDYLTQELGPTPAMPVTPEEKAASGEALAS